MVTVSSVLEVLDTLVDVVELALDRSVFCALPVVDDEPPARKLLSPLMLGPATTDGPGLLAERDEVGVVELLDADAELENLILLPPTLVLDEAEENVPGVLAAIDDVGVCKVEAPGVLAEFKIVVLLPPTAVLDETKETGPGVFAERIVVGVFPVVVPEVDVEPESLILLPPTTVLDETEVADPGVLTVIDAVGACAMVVRALPVVDDSTEFVPTAILLLELAFPAVEGVAEDRILDLPAAIETPVPLEAPATIWTFVDAVSVLETRDTLCDALPTGFSNVHSPIVSSSTSSGSAVPDDLLTLAGAAFCGGLTAVADAGVAKLAVDLGTVALLDWVEVATETPVEVDVEAVAVAEVETVPDPTVTVLDTVVVSSSIACGNGSNSITPVLVETESAVEVLETLPTEDDAESEEVGAVVTIIFSASLGIKLE